MRPPVHLMVLSLGGAFERLARYLREAIAVELCFFKKTNVNAIYYRTTFIHTSISLNKELGLF